MFFEPDYQDAGNCIKENIDRNVAEKKTIKQLLPSTQELCNQFLQAVTGCLQKFYLSGR
jgi:hypothetical protein